MGDGTVIQLASDPEHAKTATPDLKTMCVRQSSMAVHESRESLARTAMHTLALVSSRIGSVRSASVMDGSAAFTANARLAIPAIAGEITEQVAKCSLKRLNAAPHVVEQGGMMASYGTVAVVGLFFGGAAGSMSAIAAHSWARAASRTTGSS